MDFMSSIKPRAFPLPTLRAGIPRHWLGGSALMTHLANGVNLLFPAGERFFVRSVRHYLKQIADDPALVAQVKGFAGQEGHHARAHEEVFELLEAQGYKVRPFLAVYEKIAYGVLEPMFPPAYRLATTAAAEHFTAVMAENFLNEAADAPIHDAMKRLFAWHACEEIEHRAVAFDVFQRVDGRYSVRMAGLGMATLLLSGFWIGGMLYLLSQEEAPRKAAKRELGGMKDHNPFGQRVFGRAIREYTRRDFHPSHAKHLDEMAEHWINQLRSFGIEAAA